MNLVLDTHAWIWLVTGSASLSLAARDAVADADVMFVPAICLWELGMLVDKGRVQVPHGLRAFFDASLIPGRMEVAPITPSIAARTVEFRNALHGDPADRLIAATALELGLPLVTRDQRLSELQGLNTIW